MRDFRKRKKDLTPARISTDETFLAPRLDEANVKTGTGKKRAGVLRKGEAATFETSNVRDKDVLEFLASRISRMQ